MIQRSRYNPHLVAKQIIEEEIFRWINYRFVFLSMIDNMKTSVIHLVQSYISGHEDEQRLVQYLIHEVEVPNLKIIDVMGQFRIIRERYEQEKIQSG